MTSQLQNAQVSVHTVLKAATLAGHGRTCEFYSLEEFV